MVKVKQVVFGEGMPKVCIPIVGTCIQEVRSQAQALKNVVFDVVEVRLDYIDEVRKSEYVVECLHEVGTLLSQPILATFRTKQEGGEQEITTKEYIALYEAIVDSGVADMMDVELFLGDEVVSSLVKKMKAAGVTVVLSNHDFHATPSKEEIVSRLVRMQQLGADLPKIAVMPNSPRDVMTLLDATLTMREEYRETPVITMSMAGLGMISRMAGQLTGAAMTFATCGKASAPGQVPVEKLREVLELLG